jgi:N-methylhydantoinase A
MKYVVGIDVGGTFTDLVAIDEAGNTCVIKSPSTPENPGIGVVTAIEKCSAALNMSLKEFLSKVIRICHGTTVSTNAVLTLTGAKVGLLTTKGFRDITEIRTGIRENRYDYAVPQPEPLAPRHLRIGIEERVKWNGEEYIPLNEEEVRKAAKYFKKHGVQAIAICFLWSFMNPAHEKRAAEICRDEFPEAYITTSSYVLPEIREYRRFSTTAINAYVGPNLSRYIRYLVDELRKAGYKEELLITQSSAGVMSPEIASEQAMRTVLSGPACGPAAGVYVGELYGMQNLITTDMGGTSFDVALIKDGHPWMTDETDVAGLYRIRLPMVDVWTIGAGGGSIAWLGAGKALHVGPQSAGATPGPACYMKGGKEPTSTDADFVLGYLNPDYYLGGEFKVSLELARKVIKEKIADPLGIDLIEAARSIVRILNAGMVDAISAVSVRRGEDPRRYVLIAAGGAGPTHVPELAKALRIRKIIVPRLSSVFCAMGGVISDLRHDFVRTVNIRTSNVSFDQLNNVYQELEREAHDMLNRERITPKDRYFRRSMDMRYVGQFHEVDVEVPNGLLGPEQMKAVVDHFNEKHETLYAYRDITETEIINVRLAGFGKVVKMSLKEYPYDGKDASKYLKGKRDVFFEETGGFVSSAIYDGDAMKYGNVINGPAIIEQKITTVVVPPGFTIEVGKYGDFIMEVPK